MSVNHNVEYRRRKHQKAKTRKHAKTLVVTPLAATIYRVHGGRRPHLITLLDTEPVCDCENFERLHQAGRLCAHILALRLFTGETI